MMLLQAAADEWKVPVGELTVVERRHHARRLEPQDHLRQGRRGGREARRRRTRRASSSRIREDWKIAGKPLKRLDTADKLNGSKVYAIDVKLPGMLNAAIKDAPVFGGKVVELRRGARSPRCPACKKVDEGRRHRRRGGRRHLVARQDGARGAADRLGRRRRTPRSRARRSPSTSRTASTATETNGGRKEGDALKAHRGRGEEGRGDLLRRRSSRTPAWSR